MNTLFDIAFIRSKHPCYDPTRYLPEGWKGSVKGILRHRDMPAKDKIWVVLRKDLLNDKTLRLFAVACARRALAKVPNPDPRCIVACDVADSFANGIATREELTLARAYADDAYAAVYAVVYVAADAAAARAAAYAATADVTADAAYYAADASAAAAAAAYADYAAAAAYAERQWQVECLLNMLK